MHLLVQGRSGNQMATAFQMYTSSDEKWSPIEHKRLIEVNNDRFKRTNKLVKSSECFPV